MRLLIALLLMMSLALPTMAQDDMTSDMAMQENATSVVDIVTDNFLDLTEAVQTAGLTNTLQNGEYTVFAPTNGAFQTMLNNLELSRTDFLSNPALLEGVLTYHVIPGTFSIDDFQSGIADTTTVNGAPLSFGYDDDISRATINNGAASVTQPDVYANNGVVHVVDNVLLPPNVNELIASPDMTPPSELTQSNLDFIRENFVTFSAAIDAAGLTDELASGEYTIFAPTDGAFQTLENNLGISETALLADQDLLEQVLSYHVIPGRITSDEILTGSPNAMTVNGANLSFGYDDNISRVTIDGGQASIAQPDIYTNNGLVHIIDNVLLPTE